MALKKQRDQIACLENIQGDREVPDHPLVEQPLADCLHETMDIDGLENLLQVERGSKGLPYFVKKGEPLYLAS